MSTTLQSGLFWSAPTCRRFGLRRPVAAVTVDYVRRNAWSCGRARRRQVADEQSGDRSPHSKKKWARSCSCRKRSNGWGGPLVKQRLQHLRGTVMSKGPLYRRQTGRGPLAVRPLFCFLHQGGRLSLRVVRLSRPSDKRLRRRRAAGNNVTAGG